MPSMKKILQQFKEACQAAIDNDEVGAPRPYTPPTAEEIAAAEKQLGIRFPKDFIQFHRECEGYRLPFWDVFSLGGRPKSQDHIIGANLAHRRKPPKGISLPEHLVAFHDDGSLTLHCFDTRRRDSRGNYTIVTWDHESVEADPDDLPEWADSFAEWLEQQVADAASDDDQEAVIVEFQYGLDSLDPMFELEARLEAAISEVGVGDYDGNEIATDLSDGFLYMHGPSADVLFDVVKPILSATPFLKGATAVLRYGPPEEDTPERRVKIKPRK